MQRITIPSTVFESQAVNNKGAVSLTNSTIISPFGYKGKLGNIPKPKRLENRNFVSSSIVAPPTLPPSVSQDSVIYYERGATDLPPYQNPKKLYVGLPEKLPTRYRYSDITVPVERFDGANKEPQGYKHFSSDYKHIPETTGMGDQSLASTMVDNSEYVPPLDPVSQQQHIALQKGNRVQKIRYMSKDEVEHLKLKKVLRSQHKGKAVPKHSTVESHNNSELVTSSAKNFNTELDRISQLKTGNSITKNKT